LRDWRVVRREEVSEGVVQVFEILPFPMPPAPKISLTFGILFFPSISFELELNCIYFTSQVVRKWDGTRAGLYIALMLWRQ
jgi:hypothetical protein